MTKRTYRLLNMLYGGVSGVITGLVMLTILFTTHLIPAMLYMQMLYKINFYDLLAEKFRISSQAMIYIFHFGTAAILGLFFALLFHGIIKSIYGGVGIGFLFGVLWWLLTPFYILPFFFLVSTGETWHLFSSYTLLNSLIGHAVFGIILGVVYAGFKKLLVAQAR